jgi:hypothetical protein
VRGSASASRPETLTSRRAHARPHAGPVVGSPAAGPSGSPNDPRYESRLR